MRHWRGNIRMLQHQIPRHNQSNFWDHWVHSLTIERSKECIIENAPPQTKCGGRTWPHFSDRKVVTNLKSKVSVCCLVTNRKGLNAPLESTIFGVYPFFGTFHCSVSSYVYRWFWARVRALFMQQFPIDYRTFCESTYVHIYTNSKCTSPKQQLIILIPYNGIF